MKSVLRDFVAAFVLGFVLPALLLSAAVVHYEQEPAREKELPAKLDYSTLFMENPVHFSTGDKQVRVELDTYLIGVVLAEMPADFEPEALKAQAVTARTYTRKAYETGGKHGDGSLCTDPSCCQAYLAPEAYLEQGGTILGLEKVTAAVEDTAGLVLVYGDTLIEATYFSCSGGRTEAAVEVWGTDYPYLRSVASPGEENTRYYRDTVSFTPEAFAERLGILPQGDPKSWVSLAEYTDGGSVRKMVVCGKSFSGTQLREMLDLRSAAFDLDTVDGRICITTRGYGHRVGMSQYGAEAMAAKGCSYVEILNHYYPGAELKRLEPDSMEVLIPKVNSPDT